MIFDNVKRALRAAFERYRTDFKAWSERGTTTALVPSRTSGSVSRTPRPLYAEDLTERRVRKLPAEVATLLLVIGTAGVLLPGPVGSPFLIAGGLALWPRGFGRIEDWFRKRFPGMHRHGFDQIDRYLNDLELRYPGVTA